LCSRDLQREERLVRYGEWQGSQTMSGHENRRSSRVGIEIGDGKSCIRETSD
jgi:hypothetical protein